MFRRIQFSVLFFSAGVLFAGEYSGVVRWSSQPIPGVTVTAAQGEKKIVTTTDDSGRFVFKDLGPGTWALDTEMFGFAPQRREVTGDQASAVEWNLDLQSDAPATPVVASAAPAAPAAATPAAAQASKPQAPAAAPKPSLAAGPSRRGSSTQSGYQNLRMGQSSGDGQMLEAAMAGGAEDPQSAAGGGDDAFLVNGSLSRGLQGPADDPSMFDRGGFDRHRGDSSDGSSLDGGSRSDRGSSGDRGSYGDRGSSRGSYGGSSGGFSGRGGGPPGGDHEHHHTSRSASSSSFGNRSGPSRNSFRGSLFFTLGNSVANARPYSLTGQTLQQPAYASSRFGFVGGGPLMIPKLVKSENTFVFITYFGTRSKGPNSAFATMPSALERTGDFSQSNVQGPVIVADPTTHQPFAGDRIPLSRINPATPGLMSYFPVPNQPGAVQNYRLLAANPNNSDNLGVRLSRSLNAKDRLSLSVNAQSRNGNNTQLFGFHDTSSGGGQDGRLSWTHTFKSRQYNSLSVSFNRNNSTLLPFFSYGQNVAALLGIQGTSNSPINYGPPNLSFTNFGGLSDGSASVGHYQTWSLSDSFTIMKGKHNLTFGGGMTHYNNNSVSDSNARGSFTFSGVATSTFDVNGFPIRGSGYDFADFLLGLPQSSSIRFGSADTYFRTSSFNGYALDDYRARSNLSFNFGVRYEYFEPYTEKYGRLANLDIAPGFTGVAVVTPLSPIGPYSGKFPGSLINGEPLLFSPRAGLAWKPFPKHHLTVRTGYGIFFNGSAFSRFPSRLAAQPPFAKTASVNTSVAQVLTLQNGFAATPSETITNTFAVSKDYHVGYSQSWSAGFSQDLPRSFTMEATYLGNKGTGLDIQRIPNRATPGSPLTAEQRRLIGNATGFTYDGPEGNSIYHAGQLRLTRRFRSGISAYFTYTFSKSIDNSSTFGGAGNTVAQNDQNLAAERGLSSFDTRHSVSMSYVLTSPFGEKAIFLKTGGWKAKFLEDWTWSGSVTGRTGRPFTARVLGNLSDSTGTGTVGSGRADATGLPIQGASGFFNLAAFTIPPAGRFGDAARNTIPGPGTFNLNATFGRSFNLSEDRRRLELRASVDNILNHPNYSGFNAVVNASNYGFATSVGGMRTMSITARFRF